MSKAQIKTYVFTPGLAGLGTIQVPLKVDSSQLLLITNTTKNIIIYNFADPTFAGTTVTFNKSASVEFPTVLQNSDGYSTITLTANTSTHSATDTLQIFYEGAYQLVRMASVGTDAWERTRVANPQSMLDADFEYGLQPTKWAAIALMRNYPAVYEIPGTDTAVTTVTTDASTGTGGLGESLITITTASAHGFVAGIPITVKGYLNTVLGFSRAEGSFIINTVPTPTTITYYAKSKVGVSSGDILSTTYTQLRKAGFYTGASIGQPTFTATNVTSPATVTITFTSPHGLVPGNTILTSISSSGTNHGYASGPFYVETVPTLTTLTFTARATGSIDLATILTGVVYARPDAFFIHRPFDGGVMLGLGGPQHGAQAIRMSKKYIRYQSGKSINYNTGLLFAPSYDIRSMTSSGVAVGSTITIATDDVDHGLQVGAYIQISGATTTGYNGFYYVNAISDERTLSVLATSLLGNTTSGIGNPCQLSLYGWYGSSVKAGTFDEQNGQYWSYDGIAISVAYRSSTYQLTGTVTCIPDSNTIAGTNTRFTNQLAAGDRVVIKGMTHVVTTVASDTLMYVNPDFRGVNTISGVKMVKTKDNVVPQSQWNVDRCDGTGSVFNPSGYLFIPNKMQMVGIQWTWYGSGFIDFQCRGPDGNYITVHRFKNNNVNNEAYMRSGNQPVRYEILNEGGRTTFTTDPGTTSTSISVTDTTNFPPSGTLWAEGEVISYASKTPTTFNGCIRGTSFTQFASGSSRTFSGGPGQSHPIGSGVILIGQTATPNISHWGSAILQDGGFDEDRGYIFNYAATNLSVSTTKQTAFLIRLAPSVSNAIVGDLGDRELLNRAQLLLSQISVTADSGTGGIVVEGILNPQNYPASPTQISWNGLSSSASGGQPSFAQIAQGGTVVWTSGASQTTSALTSLAFPTGTISTTNAPFGTNSINNGYTYFSIVGPDYASYISSGLQVGDFLSGTGVQSNTYITSISNWYTSGGVTYYIVYVNLSFNANQAGIGSLTVTRKYNVTNTSIIFFSQAAWSASGAALGTEVSDALFPASTFVNGVTTVTYFGTTFNRITFTQTSTSSAITPGTTTITFKFGQPPYAQPGETIFSFIAAAGGQSSLDLTPLKELTNTTLGGRGAYPNGPDVLAINVYKAAGSAINTNIVLRWGEAQA